MRTCISTINALEVNDGAHRGELPESDARRQSHRHRARVPAGLLEDLRCVERDRVVTGELVRHSEHEADGKVAPHLHREHVAPAALVVVVRHFLRVQNGLNGFVD